MRIKISIPSEYPSADLSQFVGGDEFPEDDFILNGQMDYADAWFIIEGTLERDNSCLVPENRVFFLSAETARQAGFFYETPGWQGYLSQFSGVYTPFQWMSEGARADLPFLPWMVNANHGPKMFDGSSRDVSFFRQQREIKKPKNISVICSNQTLTAEHRMRLRFVTELKNHFGERLDWFGNGVDSIPQKWDGLAPYKYSIVLENQAASRVVTEKIQDAFLAHTMPIYWGALEADEIFGSKAFARIQITDLLGSIRTVEAILRSDLYDRSLPNILHAKTVVTDQLNFLIRMRKILNEPSLDPPGPHIRKQVRPLSYFTPGKNAWDHFRGATIRVQNLIGRVERR